MPKKTYVGVNNKAKEVPSKGYVGIGNKAKKLIKGYVGDANGKAQLFWEMGSVIDPWFTPKWTYKYVKDGIYDLNRADVEKTIRYPARRAIWLSDGVDDFSYTYFVKFYKKIGKIITRVNQILAENPTWNIVIVYLTTRLPEDTMIGYQIILCSGDLDDKKCYYGSQRSGGGFKYEFYYPDGTYRVVDYHKYLQVEFWGYDISIHEYDYSSYYDAEVICANDDDNPFESYACNIGIYFTDTEETDLVDYIELRGKTKEFDQYVTSEYSLNSVTVPSSQYYNNITIDANGATFTNDISFMTVPEWWVFQGYYYIEIEFGYMPATVSTVSDYLMLLEISGRVGLAYNKTAGVWGVWDRERTVDMFRPSQITALDYFANSKMRICFDLPSGTMSVYKGDTLAFTLPFIYRTFDLLSAGDLYIGGARTVSATTDHCIAGMVVKCIKVYKNRLYHNIIKKAYHEPDQYIIEGLFDIPVTLSDETAFSCAQRIYQDATLTNYYFYLNLRITSSTTKVYLALLKSQYSSSDVWYFGAYISENPFTVEMHEKNDYNGTDRTTTIQSIPVTLNGRTYYYYYQSVGYKQGGSSYRHKNYNCSFDLNLTSKGSSGSTGMWQLGYIVFTGTITNY